MRSHTNSRQRGAATLIGVLLLMSVVGLSLFMALHIAATDVADSAAQNASVEALFLAESGVEVAARRYGVDGVACNALGSSGSLGSNSFTVSNPTAGFDPTLGFNGVVLPAGQCRVRVTGTAVGSIARTIEAIVQQGGATAFGAASSNSGTGAAVTSLTITVPAGVVANDLLLAQLNVRGGTGVTFTPPAGWALVPNGRINSTTVLAQAVYYKLAGASEPASYTWSFTSGRASGGISAFRGVNTTTPINAANGQANASSTNMVAPSITTTVANTTLVGLFGLARADSATPPTGMTEVYDDASGAGPNGTTSEAAYAVQAATGATGTRTAVSLTAAENIGHLVALTASSTSGVGVVITSWREVVP